MARTHEELYPPMKISNAVDESIDLPVLIEKKQYHRPAAPVDENAEQKGIKKFHVIKTNALLTLFF